MQPHRKTAFSRHTENEGEGIHAQDQNREEQEVSLQKWSSEMHKVVQPEERRMEARERMRMEQEDSNSQKRRAWVEDMGTAGPSDWSPQWRHYPCLLDPYFALPMLRFSLSNWVLTDSPISRTKSLRLCTQVSSLRVRGVGGLPWRCTHAMENLWVYLWTGRSAW